MIFMRASLALAISREPDARRSRFLAASIASFGSLSLVLLLTCFPFPSVKHAVQNGDLGCFHIDDMLHCNTNPKNIKRKMSQ